MIAEKTLTLIALVLTAVVAVAAFFLGPEGGLVAVGGVALLAVVVAAPGLVRTYADRPLAAAPPVPATGTAAMQEVTKPWGPLVLGALGLRLVAALIFNITPFADNVAPDHGAYRLYGKLIVASWSDPRVLLNVDGYNPYSFYQYLNAAAWWLTGADPSFVLSFVNAFVGTMVAYIAGRLTTYIYGPIAGRRAFMLTAFFPSLVLWSSINLRDCWSWLAILVAVNAAHRLREHLGVREAVLLASSLAAMAFVRPYLLPIFVLGLGLSYSVTRVRHLPYAMAAMALVYVVFSAAAGSLGMSVDLLDESRLQEIQDYRAGLAYGGSAYALQGDVSTPLGALAYLPLGLARFLFAPFPWDVKSWRQVLAIPESLVWYFVFFSAMRGIFRAVRTELTRIATPLMVSIMFTAAYALVEGNEGTAYRHRAQVMPLLFVFAAADHAYRRRAAALRQASVAMAPRPAQV